MTPAKRFSIGSKHTMAKGELHIKEYFESEDGVLMVIYTLNSSSVTYTNKYVNVISNIYKFQKANGLTEAATLTEFVELQLVRSLKFGLELEVISPISTNMMVDKLLEVGINVVSTRGTHEIVSGWKVVHDSSIRSTRTHPYGFEIVSPPSSSFDDLEKICKVLEENNVKVNKSCGMHVHHDISELKRQQIIRIYNFYNKYEKVIDGLINKDRSNNNSFCKPISDIITKVNSCDTKEQLLAKIGGKGMLGYYNNIRYYKLNLRSFIYYGTIEFRQHHGSVNFEEIKNWIQFTHKIIDRSIQINDNIEPLNIPSSMPNSIFQEMTKELKIENTKLENDFKAKIKKRFGRDMTNDEARRRLDQLNLAC